MSLLLVLDADSTLIRGEVIDALADRAGVGAEVAELTAAAMRGEFDFAESLKVRVALLRGLERAALADISAGLTLTDGAEALIAHVHARGGRVGVVSGGFHDVLDARKDEWNIDFLRANRLAWRGEALAGSVEGPIVTAEVKQHTLTSWARQSDATATVAIGDGANDLQMIQAADVGIAFCAKAVLRQAADVRIDVPDLRLAIPELDRAVTLFRP